MDAFHILTICTGNICRSPVAELLLRQSLGIERFAVFSAGTLAYPGDRMPPENIRTAGSLGLSIPDAEAHRATRLTKQAVQGADLILALAQEHREVAVRLFPAAQRKAFTLVQFARLAAPSTSLVAVVQEADRRRGLMAPPTPGADDVKDPLFQPQVVYDEVGNEIAEAVNTVVSVLTSTASRNQLA